METLAETLLFRSQEQLPLAPQPPSTQQPPSITQGRPPASSRRMGGARKRSRVQLVDHLDKNDTSAGRTRGGTGNGYGGDFQAADLRLGSDNAKKFTLAERLSNYQRNREKLDRLQAKHCRRSSRLSRTSRVSRSNRVSATAVALAFRSARRSTQLASAILSASAARASKTADDPNIKPSSTAAHGKQQQQALSLGSSGKKRTLKIAAKAALAQKTWRQEKQKTPLYGLSEGERQKARKALLVPPGSREPMIAHICTNLNCLRLGLSAK